MKLLLGAAAAACVVIASVRPAEANLGGVFKQAWKCVKESTKGAVSIGADLVTKAEAIGNMAASTAVCTTKDAGSLQALGFTTAALGTIKATTDLLPTGQCKSRIHMTLAKPLGLALATIMPDSPPKKALESLADSDVAADKIWELVRAAPMPISMVPDQLDCACDLVDGALTVADLSTVASVIKSTSKTCGGVLDEAGLGFLNSWGNAVIGWLGGAYHTISDSWQSMQGKKTAASDEVVFQGEFGVYLPPVVRDLALAPDGTDVFSLKLFAVGGGWASGRTDYQRYNQLTWGELVDDCKEYYDAHKNSGDNKKKCEQFKQRAGDLARIDADHLKKQAKSMVVFRLKLIGWLEREWVWRLPPCVAPQTLGKSINGCITQVEINNDTWKLGSYKDNKNEPWNFAATGVFLQARNALPDANYDFDVAHSAALAGAAIAVKRRTYELWTPLAARRYLPLWMPKPPMANDYGCTGVGALATACSKAVEATFDSVCHPLIRDAFANAPNVLAVAWRMNSAKQTCTTALAAIPTNEANLADEGNKAVADKAGHCQGPQQDRAASSACLESLVNEWQSCAAGQVGNVLGNPLAKARACFEQSIKTYDVKASQPTSKDVKVPKKGNLIIK